MEQTQKAKMITQSTVIEMGFTKSMIEKLLPEPTLKANPHYKCASPMKLWDESVVIAVMDSDEYQEMLKAKQNRKSSAAKAVETKRAKAEMILDSVLKSITIAKIDMKQLRDEALKAKQEWYDINTRWDDYEIRNAYEADENTVERWMVNYIRHNLCTYDNGLSAIYGKTGKGELYTRLKRTILERIAETYPELSDECDNQITDIIYSYTY